MKAMGNLDNLRNIGNKAMNQPVCAVCLSTMRGLKSLFSAQEKTPQDVFPRGFN